MASEDLWDALHSSLKDYFGSSKYSDLVIRCEGRDFKVHKVVVCGQSNYFSTICDGDWKETADGVIELKEDSVGAVEAMLLFMYTFDYDGSGNDRERVSPMISNANIYSIADKYDVRALKVRAKEKFDKAVKTCWDMDDFPHAISEVYSSTPSTDRGLRDIVVDMTQEHINTLLKKEDFQAVLEETVGFAADVTKLMAQDVKPGVSTYLCPDCGGTWKAPPQSGIGYCPRCGEARNDWSRRAK